MLQPHGNLLAKSGTDFKELTRIDITLQTDTDMQAAAAAGDSIPSSSSSSSRQRPTFKTQHIEITSDIPEDPAIAEVGGYLRGFGQLAVASGDGAAGGMGTHAASLQ